MKASHIILHSVPRGSVGNIFSTDSHDLFQTGSLLNTIPGLISAKKGSANLASHGNLIIAFARNTAIIRTSGLGVINIATSPAVAITFHISNNQ